MIVLLCAVWACVLAALALMVWMFRRDDEFAGLVGLIVVTIAGFLAVVYGGNVSAE